jgi:hypothetical protein
MYIVVTERQYIPCTKNGDCNFLVLESDDEQNESKHIYVMIDHISTVELNTSNTFNRSNRCAAAIHLYVVGRPSYITIQEDQRETLFKVINNYMENSDDESESEEETNTSKSKGNKKRCDESESEEETNTSKSKGNKKR